MVDMSPEALSHRLRLMGELWELSVALMNSKVVTRHGGSSRKARAGEIRDSIRKVLFFDWDPIGISPGSELDGEYDAYISPVYRILLGTRSEDDLINRLYQIENDSIGISCGDPESLRPVARKLLELDVGKL
jgi:hypothetical protein